MKSKSTGDLALIKKMNSYIIFQCIRKHAPVSRAQISEITGLNKATVSSLVTELIEQELTYEIGPGESSGGRKPVMLLYNNSAGYAIGIDLGVNYIRGVLVDLAGEIVYELYEKLPKQTREIAFDKLCETIEKVKSIAPACRYGIVGIGVGVPGIVDQEGNIVFAPNMKWREVPLKAMLEQHFNLPVVIDNEANVGAQGEQKYGVGKGINNQLYLSVGYGIGSGLILNKELYKGAFGFSGEVGHLSIQFDGKQCSCGNLGCWELYASEKALLEEAKQLGFTQIDDIIAAAEVEHKEVLALLSKIGYYLGIGIVNLTNTFNPESIVIGNELSKLDKWLIPEIQKTVNTRSLTFNREELNIVSSQLKEKSAVLGAAYYAIERFIEQFKAIK